MRYAIYYTPGQDEKLARIAANWLGRDPFGAATRPVEAVGDLSAAEVAQFGRFAPVFDSDSA